MSGGLVISSFKETSEHITTLSALVRDMKEEIKKFKEDILTMIQESKQNE